MVSLSLEFTQAQLEIIIYIINITKGDIKLIFRFSSPLKWPAPMYFFFFNSRGKKNLGKINWTRYTKMLKHYNNNGCFRHVDYRLIPVMLFIISIQMSPWINS